MRVFVAAVESSAQAIGLSNRVAQSALRPLSVDIVGPLASALFSRNRTAPIESGPTAGLLSTARWAIVVGFSGKEKALNRYLRDLQRLVELPAPGTSSAVGSAVLDGNDAAEVFERVREFLAISLESSEAATVVKMSVLPGHMTRLVGDVERALGEFDLPWTAMLRGVGVIYVALLPGGLGETARDRVVQATERILSLCAALGGNASVPWCPREWKSSLKVWGQSPAAIEQMRKLREVFDPPGILAPGRFAGGG